MKKGIIAIIVLIVLAVLIGGWYINTNNKLVDMKGQATKQWANVESSYQRRSDLIGNLVKTVQGAADFERKTLSEVIKARAKATSTTIDANNITPEQMAQFQEAQAGRRRVEQFADLDPRALAARGNTARYRISRGTGSIGARIARPAAAKARQRRLRHRG